MDIKSLNLPNVRSALGIVSQVRFGLFFLDLSAVHVLPPLIIMITVESS